MKKLTPEQQHEFSYLRGLVAWKSMDPAACAAFVADLRHTQEQLSREAWRNKGVRDEHAGACVALDRVIQRITTAEAELHRLKGE